MKPIIDSQTHKWCASCKAIKPVESFSKNHRNRLGLDAYCKSCVSIKAKKHTKNRTINRRMLKAKLVLEFGNKCLDCGSYNLPIASFTFHHHNERMDSKTYISPSDTISCPKGKKILEEKKKWMLLCSNCHNVRHTDCKLTAIQLRS
jgi:hypothetical protein